MMCKQSGIALDFIKTTKDKAGLSETALMLAQKQCEDIKNMEQRISNIEDKVDGLTDKVDSLDVKIEEIKNMITKHNSFTANLKDVASNKVFLYLLFVLVAALCGTPVAQMGLELLK